jgi:hypothetical protein
MGGFRELLQGMTDAEINGTAARIWTQYEDDDEDGIGEALEVTPGEAAEMLDVPFDIEEPWQLADAMRAYRDGKQWEQAPAITFPEPYINPGLLGPDAETDEDE